MSSSWGERGDQDERAQNAVAAAVGIAIGLIVAGVLIVFAAAVWWTVRRLT